MSGITNPMAIHNLVHDMTPSTSPNTLSSTSLRPIPSTTNQEAPQIAQSVLRKSRSRLQNEEVRRRFFSALSDPGFDKRLADTVENVFAQQRKADWDMVSKVMLGLNTGRELCMERYESNIRANHQGSEAAGTNYLASMMQPIMQQQMPYHIPQMTHCPQIVQQLVQPQSYYLSPQQFVQSQHQYFPRQAQFIMPIQPQQAYFFTPPRIAIPQQQSLPQSHQHITLYSQQPPLPLPFYTQPHNNISPTTIINLTNHQQ